MTFTKFVHISFLAKHAPTICITNKHNKSKGVYEQYHVIIESQSLLHKEVGCLLDENHVLFTVGVSKGMLKFDKKKKNL